MDISIPWGDTVVDAYNALHLKSEETGKRYRLMFNGEELYSDETLDEMYIKVVGKTKQEFDDYVSLVTLRSKKYTPIKYDYIVRYGKGIIDPKYWDNLEKIAVYSLEGRYKGRDLKAAIDVINFLRAGKSSKAKKELLNQGHSEDSLNIVCSMIYALSDEGTDFCKTIKYTEVDLCTSLI